MSKDSKFIQLTEKKEIEKYRIIWRALCAGETVTVAVDIPNTQDFDYGEIFKNYAETFMMYFHRKTLIVKRLDEILNEEFYIID